MSDIGGGRAPASPAIEAGKGRQDKEHAMSQILRFHDDGLDDAIYLPRSARG